MFGSKSRITFRPPGYAHQRDDIDRISPTASNMSRKMPKIRIRSAFRYGKQPSSAATTPGRSPRESLLPRSQHEPTQPLSPLGLSKETGNEGRKVSVPMSPVGEQKLRLMPRIAEYRCKGYLNDEQERELYTQLQQHKINPFDNSTVQDVERKLEEYKALSCGTASRDGVAPRGGQEGPNSMQTLRDRLQKQKARTQIPNAYADNDRYDRVMRDQESISQETVAKRLYQDNLEDLQQPAHDEEDFSKTSLAYKEIPLNDRVILDASDLVDQVGEEFVENLFVEMCFFARLGFLQPTMCLRCLYMESIEGMDEDLDCKNFCVWRRNANEPLHPQALQGNLCLVECQAARKLVEGNQIQDHYWDHIKRRLVLVARYSE